MKSYKRHLELFKANKEKGVGLQISYEALVNSKRDCLEVMLRYMGETEINPSIVETVLDITSRKNMSGRQKNLS